MPFHLLNGPQVTPLSPPFQLFTNGTMIVTGDKATLNQASDGQGRTLFKDGYAGPPATWDDLRPQGDPAALPDIVPVPVSGGPNATSTTEMYFTRPAKGSTQAYDVGPGPGVAAGTPDRADARLGAALVALLDPGHAGEARPDLDDRDQHGEQGDCAHHPERQRGQVGHPGRSRARTSSAGRSSATSRWRRGRRSRCTWTTAARTSSSRTTGRQTGDDLTSHGNAGTPPVVARPRRPSGRHEHDPVPAPGHDADAQQRGERPGGLADGAADGDADGDGPQRHGDRRDRVRAPTASTGRPTRGRSPYTTEG